MNRPKEKRLFDRIHKIAETENEGFHAYSIDEDFGIRYRVDCGESGSFEIALITGSEDFITPFDEFDETEDQVEPLYVFDGKCCANLPEMDIDQAIKIVLDRIAT